MVLTLNKIFLPDFSELIKYFFRAKKVSLSLRKILNIKILFSDLFKNNIYLKIYNLLFRSQNKKYYLIIRYK